MKDRAIQTFDTLATCDGRHEVIFRDSGRPVAVRDSLRSANGLARTLDRAAASGPEALARALGCGRRR